MASVRSTQLLAYLVSCLCMLTVYAGTYEVLQDTSELNELLSHGLPSKDAAVTWALADAAPLRIK